MVLVDVFMTYATVQKLPLSSGFQEKGYNLVARIILAVFLSCEENY